MNSYHFNANYLVRFMTSVLGTGTSNTVELNELYWLNTQCLDPGAPPINAWGVTDVVRAGSRLHIVSFMIFFQILCFQIIVCILYNFKSDWSLHSRALLQQTKHITLPPSCVAFFVTRRLGVSKFLTFDWKMAAWRCSMRRVATDASSIELQVNIGL